MGGTACCEVPVVSSVVVGWAAPRHQTNQSQVAEDGCVVVPAQVVVVNWHPLKGREVGMMNVRGSFLV